MKSEGSKPGDLRGERSSRLRLATVLASLVALGALVGNYGFRPHGLADKALLVLQGLVIVFFIVHSFLRLYWSTNRPQHLKMFWYEFALVAVLALTTLTIAFSQLSDRMLYGKATCQIALVLFLIIRGTELMRAVSTSRFRPAQIFVSSFLILIMLGTGLLMLPESTSQRITITGDGGSRTVRGNILGHNGDNVVIQSGQGNELVPGDRVSGVKAPSAEFTTALFTATSAVCVTGLIVESTGSYWSPFGQGVILVLIQLGGLGIMTFGAVFALLLWRSLGLRESAIIRDVMSSTVSVQIGRILVFILLSTAVFEAMGTWCLWDMWDDAGMSTSQRAFASIFHSVSAFCNAGFCLYDASLQHYRNSWQANGVFPALIIIGGLGFLVIYNLTRIARCRTRQLLTRLRGGLPRPELDRRRLTLQTKLVLLTTAVLLVLGLTLFLLFETLPNLMHSARPLGGNPYMSQAAPPNRVAYAWFQSVTARTAGFNTVPTSELTDSSKFLSIVLMFIGASPGSTGGGIKTATLAVVICGVWSLLRNRSSTQAFQRTIPQNIFLRSLVIMTLGIAVVALATMILSVAHAEFDFLDVLFETTSAFGTVGLSTGVTGQLNHLGRLLIIAVMLIGRVGPLTLFIALPIGVRAVKYGYATENVAIG